MLFVEIQPVQWLEKPPMIVNVTKHFTIVERMLSVCADCGAANDILDTSVALGSPYVNVPHMLRKQKFEKMKFITDFCCDFCSIP